jgi:hypothetical protein
LVVAESGFAEEGRGIGGSSGDVDLEEGLLLILGESGERGEEVWIEIGEDKG